MISAGLALGLGGCLHSAPDYPGASGSAIVPAQFADAPCPDFSGTYEGLGQWIAGDGRNRWITRTLFFDYVFPAFIRDEMSNIEKNYIKGGPHRTWVPPDFAEVKTIGERSVKVTLRYGDKPIGSYHSDFSNKKTFVCTNDKLVWGAGDGAVSRSEFGPNTGDRSFAVYKDKNGDLIHERKQQVHMNLAFGIPVGTAKHFAVYRFKKIEK